MPRSTSYQHRSLLIRGATVSLLVACAPSQLRSAAVPSATWTAVSGERLRSVHDDAALLATVALSVDRETPLADPFTNWDDHTEQPYPPPAGERRQVGTSIDVEGCHASRALVQAHAADHWVALHGGRLLTVSRENQTRIVSAVEAFSTASESSPCDELLVAGDIVVVLGFRPRAGALEVGVFHIDAQGALGRQHTFWFRSEREYASRLIGPHLVLYLPLSALSGNAVNYPTAREAPGEAWTRLGSTESIYAGPQRGAVFHTIADCNLESAHLDCAARSVLAAPATGQLVGRDAVYLWTADRDSNSESSMLYRLPLRGGAPGAIRSRGALVDPQAFDEHGEILRLLVRSPDHALGSELAIARAPIAAFSGNVPTLQPSAYLRLAAPTPDPAYARFVGDWLLSASRKDPRLHVWSAVQSDAPRVLQLESEPDRIDALGRGALISGRGVGNVTLSALDLERATIVDREILADDSARGERHVLGLFYNAMDAASGYFGIPVYGEPDWIAGRRVEQSAEVLFFRESSLQLERIGALTAHSEKRAAQPTEADDWYSNTHARPLYFQTRVVALVGDELIEGDFRGNAMSELRRLNLRE